MRLFAPRWTAPTQAAAAVVALAVPTFAFAHPGADAGLHHGFAEGLVHPFTGLDHVLAMGAVGVWAGLRGGASRWLAPLVFVALLVAGALAGAAGLAPAGVEPLVAASLVVLGLLLAGYATPSVPLALAVIGGFALVHGAAHGVELGAGAALAGMAAGSALLHVAGLALAHALRSRPGPWAAALGTGTMAIGAALLLG
jgi:urease accessory protein